MIIIETNEKASFKSCYQPNQQIYNDELMGFATHLCEVCKEQYFREDIWLQIINTM